MEGTIKPPLITPSISPPPPPPPSFFPLPFKISDAAPPAKRRRISSANRQLQPTSHSSLNFDDPVYFEKAREDSAFRLWDAWSQLEDRYARGLDEDDIIDLEAQEIVKDRGVIRGVKKQWKFGCLVEGEGEEEEDTDDLDAISDKSSGEEGNPLTERFRHVPPVTEMDPADAEDLKRFLEAERRRKESCPGGAEDSEESEHERVPLAQNVDHDSQLPSDPVRVEAPGQESPTRNASPGKRAQQLRHEKGAKSTTPDDNPPYYVDSGSEDELEVNWKLDEASVVYRVRKVEDSDDSDIEVIGPPTKILSGSGIPKPNFPRHLQTQLHTPPQSQVSLSSATPSDDIFSTFQSSSLPPSSPPPSSPPPSSPLPSSTLPSPTKPLSIVRSRLQYPMLSRSSPSSHASTSRTQLAPIPRLDLSKLQSKANPSSSKPKTPDNRERDRGVLPSITGSTPNISSYHRAKSMTVEVVLDRRPTPKSSPPRASSSVKSAITKTSAKKRPKSQNREHKTNPQPTLTDVEDQLGESDGSLTIRSPLCSPQKLAPIPLKTAAPRAGARNMAPSGPSRLPEPPPLSRANKRKRAISISSSGSEREEAPGQPLSARPVFLRPRKQDDVCESEDTSGYTSGEPKFFVPCLIFIDIARYHQRWKHTENQAEEQNPGQDQGIAHQTVAIDDHRSPHYHAPKRNLSFRRWCTNCRLSLATRTSTIVARTPCTIPHPIVPILIHNLQIPDFQSRHHHQPPPSHHRRLLGLSVANRWLAEASPAGEGFHLNLIVQTRGAARWRKIPKTPVSGATSIQQGKRLKARHINSPNKFIGTGSKAIARKLQVHLIPNQQTGGEKLRGVRLPGLLSLGKNEGHEPTEVVGQV
ncbi:hypothetical protein BD779DRAFT_1500046 [Infundibulicybe gibba]|nr:hypothetical protein BD779DRAFT_1500046 [Infundibulicybe gibba]